MKDIKRVLTVEQSYVADRATINSGISGIDLMHNAGRRVFEEITGRWNKCKVLILCGPGNNGGDGFVVAKLLQDAGWEIYLMAMKHRDEYKGDAKKAADEFSSDIYPLSADINLSNFGLVVDALFGIGFSKLLRDDIANLFTSINEADIPVVAVDIPSGVDGNTGAVDKNAVRADLTVSFCCKKTGHLLYPAREYVGKVIAATIGIKPEVYEDYIPKIYENSKALWVDEFPKLSVSGHKYSRGHTVIYGGSKMTGAARLAASAAMRIGSGLTSIVASREVFPIYASHKASLLVEPIETSQDIIDYLSDDRKNTILIGSGAGVSDDLKDLVLELLSKYSNSRNFVIDADAISSFEDCAEEIFPMLGDRCVLTPHKREFERLFGNVDNKKSKVEIALAAANKAGAVIILKGADTVIASPDGQAAINTNAPPYLATAGSGDVLAGMVAGLLAQNMPSFEAACCAVWLHGECANNFGRGLIADDIAEELPNILSKIF